MHPPIAIARIIALALLIFITRPAVADQVTEPSTQPSLTWHRKSLADVKAAAAKGDGDAQLELYERYSADTDDAKADTAEAMKWLHKAAQSGLPAAEWILANKQRDGDGVPKDPMAATGLYKKLSLQRVEAAQEALASVGPEALKAIAQTLKITDGRPEPAQAGAVVKVQGKVKTDGKGWTVTVGTAKPADVTVDPPVTGADKVKSGVVATVWGRLDSSGDVKGYLAEVPPATVDFTYSLQNSSAGTSRNPHFIVVLTVRNTGQQPVKSVAMHITLAEANTELHTEKTVTVKDIKPGESKKTNVDLTLEQHRGARVSGSPQVTVTAGEIE